MGFLKIKAEKGLRKYTAYIKTIYGVFALIALTILYIPDQAIGIIVAIGGVATSIMIPFVQGNNVENRNNSAEAK